jgi:hypothetical protein
MLDPAILLLIAVISFGLALASRASLFGLPLALILVSWFFKYCYALLDDVAFGVQAAPVLSVEMVNPVAQRPTGQLAIVLAVYALSLWVDGWLRVALLSVCALCLPASVAILGASGRFVQAINPWAWCTVIRALGRYYLGVLAIVGVCVLLLVGVAKADMWLIAKLAIMQFVVVAVFNAIGAALYERRDELDLEVLRAPERTQEREHDDRKRSRGRLLDEIYAHVRARKYAQLAPALNQWLADASRGQLQEDALEMMRAVQTWNDARAMTATADVLIVRLYDARLIAEALEAWELTLNANPAYRLQPAEKAAALAELSALAGKRGLARRIAAQGSAADQTP